MTDNLPALPQVGNRLEQLAQAHENEAFALLVETIRDPTQKLENRLKAAERILDQARGKPKVAAPQALKKQKAVSMSLETLMKIASKAVARVEAQDRTKRQGRILEGEFVAQPRRRPVNEYALPSSAAPAPQDAPPVVPGTSELDDLLS